MLIFLLFVGLGFCLHSPVEIFLLDNKSVSDVDFYEEFLFDDWVALDSTKKRTVFNDFLKKELSCFAAERLGLHLSPSFEKKLIGRSKGLLINNTYDHLVGRPFVSFGNLKKHDFFLKQKVEAYHLLVGFSGSIQNTDSFVSKDAAKALIDSLYLEILVAQKESSDLLVDIFKGFSEKHSIDPSAKENFGFLGWVPWGRTVMSFQEPLFSLDIGVVSSPVLTEYGYHLILKTNQKNSNYYYYSPAHYKDLTYKIAQASVGLDSLRFAASAFDTLLINSSALTINRDAIASLVLLYNNHKNSSRLSGNKSSFLNWLNSPELESFVLCVYNGRGFGVGWLVGHIEDMPSTRVPQIKTEDDLVLLIKNIVLQDLVLLEGEKNNIKNTTSFIRDYQIHYKNLLYNEYVSFLLNTVGSFDSLVVEEEYNSGVFRGDFISPLRAVYTEIRVFNALVADSLQLLLDGGRSFDSLLSPFGGSIKQPISIGNISPIGVVAFELPVGVVSDIIKNNDGSFSIVRVEQFLDEEPFLLSRVYSQIERRLVQEEQKNIKDSLFVSLLDFFGVSINYSGVGL